MQNLPFKISVLVFVKDADNRQLLIERAKQPNKGSWSPIGGKLEMALGESPFQCAVREVKEEIDLDICEKDLHLFSIVSERAYESDTHWLMFLFDCRKAITELPNQIGEGRFGLFSAAEIETLKIPDTDRAMLWSVWKKYSKDGFAALRVDCGAGGKLDFILEEEII